MLVVKKVGSVSRVKRHGDEAVPGSQYGAGPLPHATHLSLSRQATPTSCHWDWVPMVESHVSTIQVYKELLLALSINLGNGRG